VGRVSYYLHHGSWWVYYLDGQRQVRRRVGDDEKLAAQTAAQVNADAGALRLDRVRLSFIRIAESVGLTNATCPKSWRHSYATLLQDANVDPLIRQITLGHAPSSGDAQSREGRRVGGTLNSNDVSSEYCQRKKDLIVERLDKFDKAEIRRPRSGPRRHCKVQE
jgi:hypothetical protein